jgi:hypothetical protein
MTEGLTHTPNNVWYCKTLLLFDMEAETDSGLKSNFFSMRIRLSLGVAETKTT